MASNDKYIWDYLLKELGNEFGVAGIWGNVENESGFKPNNLQDTFNKSLGMTDEQYTDAVNLGTYSKDRFIKDSAGYGLVQWTFWTLKRDMYEYIKEKKHKSIDDLDTQLECLVYQLKKDFKGLWESLKTSTSVRHATELFFFQFENPNDKSQAQIDRRVASAEKGYKQYAKGVKADSKLVDVVILSPNKNVPRQSKIKKITIHHMAGFMTVEECGKLFADPSREGSSNYGIDTVGRVGQYVLESDRAWTSGSAENDNQAVTIEVANCKGAPNWEVSDAAYNKLIDLCVDICKRNGIKKLDWTGDKNGNLTCHYMFQATACPGPYLKSKMSEIARLVNQKLGVKEEDTSKVVKLEDAHNKDLKYRKAFTTTDNLNLRWGAGTDYPIMVEMPKGTTVNCYGYYNIVDNTPWLLVVAKVKYTTYTGYCSSHYLKEV